MVGGCEALQNPFAYSRAPDYRIRLTEDPDGRLQAVPPECPSWRTESNSFLQNEPWPQYGCANARTLAAMIERPEDLLEGRELGPASGTVTAQSIRRYNEGKTTALIDPNAKAPVQMPQQAMTNEKGGGGQGGSTQQ